MVSDMAELKCTVTNCGYNKDKLCCKGDITVGGKSACTTDETCCESFREKKADSYSNAMDNPCRTISIDCEARNCMYNKESKCYADHVDIKGSGASDCQETACATFKER